MKYIVLLIVCISLFVALLLFSNLRHNNHNGKAISWLKEKTASKPKRDHTDDFFYRLAYSAEDIVDPNIIYDGSYQQIAYPGGDVSPKRGVCADVLIRAYRQQDIDLQQLLHEDMLESFSAYPQNWHLKRPDANIDHRRVLNLAAFFKRHGSTLPVTENAADYQPGDIVCWSVSELPHIGIVSSCRNSGDSRYQIVHNIGAGQVMEDVLFAFKITGHYRYQPVKP